MRKNKWAMKMFLTICLIGTTIMGCENKAVVEQTKVYYFSEDLGFQQDNKPIWYEMDGEPIVIKNNDQTITIESVLWQDYQVILSLLFENYSLNEEGHSQVLDHIKIYSPDLQRTMNGNTYSWSQNDSGELYGAEITYDSYDFREAKEAFSFEVFGEKYTVSMKPIQTYNSLDDIGTVQTHNGRSLVIRDDGTERKAYTYSNDIWKISNLVDMRKVWNSFHDSGSAKSTEYFNFFKWNRVQSKANSSVFQCIDDTIADGNSFEISGVCLTANCEDLQIPIPLDEGKQTVDIPFAIGNDQYSIYKIEVKTGTEGNNPDIYIRIKNVDVEKGTKLYSLDASLGVEKEILGHNYDPATGKSDTKVYGTRIDTIGYSYSLWGDEQFQESFEDMEPVICIELNQSEEMPDEAILKIENASKSWDQIFSFEMK